MLETEVRPLVEQFLAARGLTLSPDKTVVTHIEQGFDFLGQSVRRYNGKTLIKPSKASDYSLRREARRIIRGSGSLTAGQLVQQLNPLLRGWAQYHRHAVSYRVFQSIDNYIWHRLLRWARRRHPGRSSRWVIKRYFLPHERRRNVFTGTIRARGGPKTVRLFRTGSVPIRRQILVRGACNPFDPTWNDYLRLRHQRLTLRSVPSPRPIKRAAVEA